jgi:hypothetical protein
MKFRNFALCVVLLSVVFMICGAIRSLGESIGQGIRDSGAGNTQLQYNLITAERAKVMKGVERALRAENYREAGGL